MQMNHVTIHRTFRQEAKPEGKPKLTQVVWYTDDGQHVEQLDAFPQIEPTEVRTTSWNGADVFFSFLEHSGHVVKHCHYATSGLAKGRTEVEIVKAYHALPDEKFVVRLVRPEIAELRHWVNMYRVLDQLKGDTVRRITQELKQAPESERAELEKQIRKAERVIPRLLYLPRKGKNGKIKEITFERRMLEAAEKVPECGIFRRSAHLKGPDSKWAAMIVAYSGSMDRFPSPGAY